MVNFGKNDLEQFLREDNSLQRILFPTLNQKVIEKTKDRTYIFENGEKFKGRINNNIFQKGVYTWPNKQEFYGDLSPNNRFNKKGKIIFPNKDELTGTFNPDNNTITKALYKTSTRSYQGSYKRNRLDGKFIIKNNKDCEHYLFTGSYLNGVRDGKFTLEKIYNGNKIKVIGKYENGKKNGDFKVFNLEKNDNGEEVEKSIFEEYYENDFIKKEEIKYKQFLEYKETKDIFCMETIEDNNNNLYLLLGSKENLLIYSINIEKKEFIFFRKALLFKNADINDILKLKDEKFLICSNNNNIKFIEFMEILLEKSLTISESKITNATDNIFRVIQELKGEPDSKSIFTLIELSNEMVVSGDSENIILWEKSYLNNNSEKFINSDSGKNSSIYIDKKNSIQNEYYEFIKKGNKKYYHIYCMLEIKNVNNINNLNNINNNILLAVARPDTRTIEIIEIQENGIINEINTIYKVNTVQGRKNLMLIYKNNLLVGCKDKVVIIDLNNYEIIYNVYTSNEPITYINSYLDDDYLLFGCMKTKNMYNFEGYLSQKKLIINDDKINLISVSEFEESKFEGNIINSCKYKIQNKEIIISIGTNGKILILIIS